MKAHNPTAVAAPTAYSHGIELPPGARLLYIAGQTGVNPDGTMAPTFTGQAEQAWRNLLAVLADAGMEVGDLVKVNHYLTRQEDLATYRAVRSQFLGENRPASTLLVISALARDGALVEVEAVAAKT